VRDGNVLVFEKELDCSEV